MKAATFLYENGTFFPNSRNRQIDAASCQLVLGFGGKEIIGDARCYANIKKKFPGAEIALCSTAGEIFQAEVHDGSLSLTAFEFEHTPIKTVSIKIKDFQNSYYAGVHRIGGRTHGKAVALGSLITMPADRLDPDPIVSIAVGASRPGNVNF